MGGSSAKPHSNRESGCNQEQKTPQPKTEEWGKGMGGKGIGARQEKAEEVRQNDGGKITQTQTLLVLSLCRP
jgi:hypothetical protein